MVEDEIGAKPPAQVGAVLQGLNFGGEQELTHEGVRELQQRMPGLVIARAGGEPFTAEGVLATMPFYLRYRHHSASLRVGLSPMEKPLYQATVRWTAAHPDRLTPEEFAALLTDLIPRLTRAPFLYEFAGKAVRLEGRLQELQITATEEPELFRAWGATPEDAYRKISQPSEELAKVGLSRQLQEEIFKLQEVSPQPLNEDDRVFPDPEPTFALSN